MAATYGGMFGRWASAAVAAGCMMVGMAHAQGASAFVPRQFNPVQNSGGVQYGAGNRNGYNPYNNPYYYGPNVDPTSLPPGSVILPDGQIYNPNATANTRNFPNGIPTGSVILPNGQVSTPNGNGTPNGNPGPFPPGVGTPVLGKPNSTQYPGGGWYQDPSGAWIPIPKGGTVTQNPFDGKPPANVGLKRKSPRVAVKSPWSEKSFQDAHSYDKAKNNRPIGAAKPQ